MQGEGSLSWFKSFSSPIILLRSPPQRQRCRNGNINKTVDIRFCLLWASDQTIETQLLKSMIRTTMAQEAYTELATQLRQLEGVAIEIELSINRLAVVLGQTGAEARRAEWLLRQADDSGLIGLKPEVTQVRRACGWKNLVNNAGSGNLPIVHKKTFLIL